MPSDEFSIFDRFEKDLTGVLLSILILMIIKNEKRIWGYDIKQHLKKITDEKIEINNSTVYTILKSFESKYMLLESEMEDRRRYYKLTNKGQIDLIKIIKDWQKMTSLTYMSLKKLGFNLKDILEE